MADSKSAHTLSRSRPFSPPQVLGEQRELVECCLQVLDDLSSDHVWCGKDGGILHAFIP